jgi:hypothetical protein
MTRRLSSSQRHWSVISFGRLPWWSQLASFVRSLLAHSGRCEGQRDCATACYGLIGLFGWCPSSRTTLPRITIWRLSTGKLIEMVGRWYVEAGKYDVLPIDSRGTLRLADERPQIAKDRTRYTYYPGTQTVPPNSSPGPSSVWIYGAKGATDRQRVRMRVAL